MWEPTIGSRWSDYHLRIEARSVAVQPRQAVRLNIAKVVVIEKSLLLKSLVVGAQEPTNNFFIIISIVFIIDSQFSIHSRSLTDVLSSGCWALWIGGIYLIDF